MKEIFLDDEFDVCEVTRHINSYMSKWSIHFLDIVGPNWIIYDWEMHVKAAFVFQVDFNDLDTRIKLEDLKLNVIHHIESLRDETTYRDNLVNPSMF